MDTKVLLSGIAGLLIGGLIVSIAATMGQSTSMQHGSLEGVSTSEFDAAYTSEMIKHHEGAVEMAEQAIERSEREEIVSFSEDMITQHENEINQLRGWQQDWQLDTSMHSSGH